jgi:hypothetical protein
MSMKMLLTVELSPHGTYLNIAQCANAYASAVSNLVLRLGPSNCIAGPQCLSRLQTCLIELLVHLLEQQVRR